ncbi:hypothetical protein ACFQ2B_34425 [Streptomyces stramineus]
MGADRAGAAACVEAVDEPGESAGAELDVVVGPQPAGVTERPGQPECRVDRAELPRPGSANPATGTVEILVSRRSRATASACSPGPYCMPSQTVSGSAGRDSRTSARASRR